MNIQNILNKFLSLFVCFNPFRKPEYMKFQNDDDCEYGNLADYETPNYTFIIRK